MPEDHPSSPSGRIGLFLARYSRYGGVEQFGYRLSAALAEAGHEVEFVCARQEAEPAPGVRVVPVGRYGLFRWAKLAWFMLAAEFVRRRRGYDLSISLGKTLRADLVRNSGGPERVFWRLTRRIYPRGLPRILKRFRRSLLEPQAPLKRCIERSQLHHARVCCFVSHKTLDWMRDEYPDAFAWDDPARTRVVYNKPDLERFQPATPDQKALLRKGLGLSPDETAVGFAGTDFARKGLRAMIAAMPLLPRECVLLVAGGRGPGAYLRQAERTGVADRVRFLGRVDDMAGFYQACDVFVSPSLHDTCSNAVLEALATGCRVVCSSDDGSSHFVDPARVLADPEDEREIADRTLAALRENVVSVFTWPEETACGIEPYVELAQAMLARK